MSGFGRLPVREKLDTPTIKLAKDFGLSVSVFPPLTDPYLFATVLAWADAPLLISFSTH